MRRARFACGVIAVSTATFLAGCKTPDPVLDDALSKAVVMTYSHVANVQQMDVSGPSGTARIAPVDASGFWAVFDICSLDVQGSALTGFEYDASSFFVDGGTVQYGSMNPGTVNAAFGGGGGRSALDPLVQSTVHDTLKLGPPTQHFPKQLFLNLHFRVAVYVNENPPGYQGGTLTLKYARPATVVESVSPANPVLLPFFSFASAPIAGNCP